MADDKAARKQQKAEQKAKLKEENKNLKVWYQYLIALIIVLGGFSFGASIGWSSPAAGLLEDEGITKSEFAWISSIFALGAAITQFIVMLLIRWIGLKWTIIVAHGTVLCGWIPITLSYKFYPLLFGRMVCGMNGGFCVACPMYLGEAAHKQCRGTIMVLFQLFITFGILCAYISGFFKQLIILNIGCGAVSVVGIVLMVLFVPESPYWLLKMNKIEKFDKVMKKFRGKEFDYSKEQSEMQATIDNKESVKEGFKQKVNLKAFGVLLGVHIIQQLSGINAILYHAHTIFAASNTNISSDISVIIIGIAQIIFSLIAALVVDYAGRVMLFTISLAIMCVCLVLTGVYFMVSEAMQKILAVLPTIALVMYIAGFALGTGPLPWTLLGEYLSSNVKAMMGTIIACVNFLLAFATSWLMPLMMEKIAHSVIFYGFAVVCALGIAYLLLVVVETKHKTFEEIQNDIKNHKPGDALRKKQPNK